MTKKLLTLTCFFLTIGICGCDKEDWTTLELNQNECENVGLVMAQFDDAIGFIRKVNLGLEITYIEISDKNDTTNKANILPCNLEISTLSENTKIKFGGVLYQSEEEPYSAEYVFNRVKISKAQIVE